LAAPVPLFLRVPAGLTTCGSRHGLFIFSFPARWVPALCITPLFVQHHTFPRLWRCASRGAVFGAAACLYMSKSFEGSCADFCWRVNLRGVGANLPRIFCCALFSAILRLNLCRPYLRNTAAPSLLHLPAACLRKEEAAPLPPPKRIPAYMHPPAFSAFSVYRGMAGTFTGRMEHLQQTNLSHKAPLLQPPVYDAPRWFRKPQYRPTARRR